MLVTDMTIDDRHVPTWLGSRPNSRLLTQLMTVNVPPDQRFRLAELPLTAQL